MLWQRFSEYAKRTVFYAQEQAKELGLLEVATEHLLFGLLRQAERPGVWPPPPIGQAVPSNAAAFVLRELGADIAVIRAELERHRQAGNVDVSQDRKLASDAKRVIEIAYDEARRLNHTYIGTEHLLLGLIGVEEGVSRHILAHFGVAMEPARDLIAGLPPIIHEQTQKKRPFWQFLWGKRQTQG